MPLIWNDAIIRWVGDDEPYDTFEYVVVHKIFIKLEPSETACTESDLEKFYKKYGPVERVELHQSARSPWAYVTFREGYSACIAINMNELEGPLGFAKILPAYTWQQPSVLQRSAATTASVDNVESSLLVLNDDCLLKIFDHCDLHTQAMLWKVCRRTKHLLEEFTLSKVDEYSIDFRMGRSVKPLKRIHEELECVGRYVKKLCLTEIRNPMATSDFEFQLQQCKKYIGASMREFRLIDMRLNVFDNLFSDLLEPLLLHVESIFIRLVLGRELESPFNFRAPKLKSLTVDVNEELNVEQPERKMFFLNETYPHLERLVLRISPSSEHIGKFLQNNAQLKYLQLPSNNFHELSSQIADVATELEELVLYEASFGIDYEGNVFWPLEKCQNLKKIVLHNCVSLDFDVNPILDIVHSNLIRLKYLRSIMVTSSTLYFGLLPDNTELYADLGRQLPHLEYFCTNFLLKQNTIIELVKHARHLKVLCVSVCEDMCPVTIDFIKILADARKSLFENGCNNIFVLELIFIFDPPKEQAAYQSIELDPEMAKYVDVSFQKSSAEKYFDPKLLESMEAISPF